MVDNKTNKSLVHKAYGKNPVLETKTLVDPTDNELQVKVMASTICPADLFHIPGMYGSEPHKLESTLGLEGSGLIEKVGKNLPQDLVGKKCAIIGTRNKEQVHNGVWAQYVNCGVNNVVPFDNKDLTYDEIAFTFINPLTALGFVDTVKKSKFPKSVAFNGGNSSFSKMFIKLCKKEGLKTIACVRKDSQIEELKKIGATVALNTESTTFDKDFKAALLEAECGNFFECVGGKATSKIFSLLLPGSTLRHYGNLAGEGLDSFNTADFVFHKKTVTGFWLSTWMEEISPQELGNAFASLVKSLSTKDGIFDTTVNNDKSYGLEDFEQAVKDYSSNMSKGKVLLRPNKS